MPLSFKKTQNQETDSKIEEQKNLQQQNEEDVVEEHENLLKTQENNDHSEQLLCETYESFLNDIGLVQELRNDFDSIEEQAKEICGNFTDAIYSTDFRRSRKRKRKFDDNCDDDIQFSAKNNFKINTFYVIS
ncbi:hypothetical protein ILUMI_24163 [Ignelater luminosus]|uniref:Uncharacterized protein n=1 Tax=Ignelater luminosus TaxID=2038154 RepID=A0A8K0FWN7_IGNLU|nr:hypothetical protein ILUMI_24163 [Ignelater luminosus]